MPLSLYGTQSPVKWLTGFRSDQILIWGALIMSQVGNLWVAWNLWDHFKTNWVFLTLWLSCPVYHEDNICLSQRTIVLMTCFVMSVRDRACINYNPGLLQVRRDPIQGSSHGVPYTGLLMCLNWEDSSEWTWGFVTSFQHSGLHTYNKEAVDWDIGCIPSVYKDYCAQLLADTKKVT